MTPLLWVEQTGRRRYVVTALGTPYWSAGASPGGALLDLLVRFGFRLGVAVMVNRTHENGFCAVPAPQVVVRRNPPYAWEYTMTKLDLLKGIIQGVTDGIARHRIASDPGASHPVLEQLAKDILSPVRRAVASNPVTPASILEHLAADTDVSVRRCVADHPNTPPAVLHRFAVEKPVFVILLHGVAGNPSVEAATLAHLATDSDESIRMMVAQNPQVDEPTLRRLATDSDTFVRLHVAFNIRTPRDVLTALSQTDPQTVIRKAAAATLLKQDPEP